MTEQSGTVTLKGNPLTLIGEQISVGDKAPEVELSDGWLSSTKLLSGSEGKIRLVNVVPSLFTGICDAQTRRFSEELGKFGDVVVGLTISTDPPPSQTQWCGAAGVENIKMLSDHKDMAFGEAYGTHVEELRAEQRAVFIIDSDNTVRYVEYVPEIAQHPDYDAALAALREVAG